MTQVSPAARFLSDPEGMVGSVRKWLPLVAICTGTFMLLIDITIVNVALPDMATDLSTTFSQLQWVVDIYALALAALVLGAGSLADLYGRRRLYLIGLVLFALGVAGLAGWRRARLSHRRPRACRASAARSCSPPRSR